MGRKLHIPTGNTPEARFARRLLMLIEQAGGFDRVLARLQQRWPTMTLPTLYGWTSGRRLPRLDDWPTIAWGVKLKRWQDLLPE
jgi:hypothetical protein